MSQICAGTHPDCWRGVIKVVKIEKIPSPRRNVWKQNFCVWSSLTISMIFITFSMSQIFLTVSPVGTCSLHHCLQLFLWGLTSRFKVDQRSTKKCREPFDEPTILSNIFNIWIAICYHLKAYAASVLSNVKNKYFKSYLSLLFEYIWPTCEFFSLSQNNMFRSE